MRFTKMSICALALAALTACGTNTDLTPTNTGLPTAVEPPPVHTPQELVLYPILADVKALNVMTSNTLEAQLLSKCGPGPDLLQLDDGSEDITATKQTLQKRQDDLEALLACRKQTVSILLPERKEEISTTRLLRPDITDAAMRDRLEDRILAPANLKSELAQYGQNNKQITNALGHISDMGL